MKFFVLIIASILFRCEASDLDTNLKKVGFSKESFGPKDVYRKTFKKMKRKSSVAIFINKNENLILDDAKIDLTFDLNLSEGKFRQIANKPIQILISHLSDDKGEINSNSFTQCILSSIIDRLKEYEKNKMRGTLNLFLNFNGFKIDFVTYIIDSEVTFHSLKTLRGLSLNFSKGKYLNSDFESEREVIKKQIGVLRQDKVNIEDWKNRDIINLSLSPKLISCN